MENIIIDRKKLEERKEYFIKDIEIKKKLSNIYLMDGRVDKCTDLNDTIRLMEGQVMEMNYFLTKYNNNEKL